MIDYEGVTENFILSLNRTGHCDNIDIYEIYFILPTPPLHFSQELFIEVWGPVSVLAAGGIMLKKIKQINIKLPVLMEFIILQKSTMKK